jgi:hypothetical protein
MAKSVIILFDSLVTITWTTIPAGNIFRGSVTQPNTNERPSCLLFVTATLTGAALGAVAEYYLLRHNGAGTPIGDDLWAGTEANLTLRTSPMLGAMPCVNSATATVRRTFDTRVLGPLGPNWGIGIRNSYNTASTMNTAFGMTYKYYYTDVS